jgi:hypothetical protein
VKHTTSPIAIFCFKRFDLLKKLLKSLKKNKDSRISTVFFFSDYSANNEDNKNVEKVRNLIKNCDFFKKKIVILRKKNFGLKKNILTGIDYVFSKHKKIIVLEDDLEITTNFLKITNILLNKYEMEKSISTISGFSFSKEEIKKSKIDKYFFLLKRPSSWGWSTWKSKWLSLKKIKINKKIETKVYGNDLKIMDIKQQKRILNSWAYNWTIKHINSKTFCLYPKFSMIKNNGFDNHATNNSFKKKKNFSKIKSINLKNYLYQEENDKIKNLSKSHYDINPIMFFIKYVFFNLFYAKPEKIK